MKYVARRFLRRVKAWYTLRGRLESRLVGVALPFAVACIVALAIRAWWPVELFGLMLAVGLVLDVGYHRYLPYQPGWAAVPLGLLELAATMGLVRLFGLDVPLEPRSGSSAGRGSSRRFSHTQAFLSSGSAMPKTAGSSAVPALRYFSSRRW